MSKKCRFLLYCILLKLSLKKDYLSRQGTSIKDNATKFLEAYGLLTAAKFTKNAAGQDNIDYWYSSDDGLLPQNLLPIARSLNSTINRRLSDYEQDEYRELRPEFLCINQYCLEQCFHDKAVLGYCTGDHCMCMYPDSVKNIK